MIQADPASAIITIELANERATLELAAKIAACARTGDVIALSGELGTGKTTFARGFIHALSDTPEEVPSPTFTLVQTYESARGLIYHLDLFRLNDPEEAIELGIEEAFAMGITLIEWPEKLGPFLPQHRLEVALSYGNTTDERFVTLNGISTWSQRLQETCLG